MEASQTMDDKIHDLLEFGRLGHQPVHWNIVDLSSFLRQLLEAFRADIATHDAEVKVDYPLPQVLADPQMLEQVLSNLIRNALTFVSPQQKTCIRFWAEQREGAIWLCIEDNGIGIHPAYQEKIFGIFEQLHEPGVYPGTGMGLAIARKAMERMGGHIGVTSQPGQGSRFWLELKPVPAKIASAVA